MAGVRPNMRLRSLWFPQNAIARLLQIEIKSKMMLDVALVTMMELVSEKTYPYVPYKEGYLEGHFPKQFMFVSGSPLASATLTYSAIANDGFDYARVQHYGDYEHPVRKAGKKPSRLYLAMGLQESAPMFAGVVSEKLMIGLM